MVQSMSSSGSASLDQFASVGSSLLQQCHGSAASFTAAVGSSCLAPHIHCDTVRHWFGAVKKFPAISLLLCVLSPGSPVGVARGGDLSSELAYGNHPSVASHAAVAHDKVCTDVIHVLWFLVRVLRPTFWLGVPGLAVVLVPKFRTIHYLTFARAGGQTSVNDDTDSASAPPCELGHALRDVLLRVLFSRQRRGITAQILLCRVEVKDVFRQVPVYPAGAPTFGYVDGGHVIVDLCLQFGWWNSPGY